MRPQNVKLNALDSSTNIIWVNKSRRMKLAGRVVTYGGQERCM